MLLSAARALASGAVFVTFVLLVYTWVSHTHICMYVSILWVYDCLRVAERHERACVCVVFFYVTCVVARFIRKKPELLLGSLSFLKNEPGLLDFENKRNLMRTLLANPDEATRNALDFVAEVIADGKAATVLSFELKRGTPSASPIHPPTNPPPPLLYVWYHNIW